MSGSSDSCARPSGLGVAPAATAISDALRGLVAETTAAVAQLRGQQIPQQVGMAAACRALAVELPRVLAQQLEADVTSGELGERWAAAKATASEALPMDTDSTLAAVALLLREQGRASMRYLALRNKDWTADAYRLEGQADALEAQRMRLERAAAAAEASIDGTVASAPGPGAEG